MQTAKLLLTQENRTVVIISCMCWINNQHVWHKPIKNKATIFNELLVCLAQVYKSKLHFRWSNATFKCLSDERILLKRSIMKHDAAFAARYQRSLPDSPIPTLPLTLVDAVMAVLEKDPEEGGNIWMCQKRKCSQLMWLKNMQKTTRDERGWSLQRKEVRTADDAHPVIHVLWDDDEASGRCQWYDLGLTAVMVGNNCKIKGKASFNYTQNRQESSPRDSSPVHRRTHESFNSCSFNLTCMLLVLSLADVGRRIGAKMTCWIPSI